MATKINYNNKAPFQTLEEIPNENKVNADDMNEIKQVVNANADELDTAKENIESLQGGQGTSNAEITNLKNRVGVLETDNSTNKTNIKNLQEKVSILENDNTTNKSNIEKLQQDNETNKTNINSLQNNDIEIKSNISNLKDENAKQDNEINNIKKAFINKETEANKSIYINDAKTFGQLNVLGNYEQNGEPSEENPVEIKCVGDNKKNLFSLNSKIENVYLSIASLVETDQDYDIYYTEINPEKEYVLSMKYKEGWAKGYNIRFGYNDEIPQIDDEIYYSTTETLGDINSIYIFNPSNIWDYEKWCKYLFIAIPKEAFEDISNIQLEEGDTRTEYVPYGQGSTEIKIENFDKTQLKNYNLIIQKEMLLGDYFEKEADGWKEIHNWEKINSYNGENITTDYISTTGALTIGATVYYKLQTPDILTCTKEQVEILNQLDNLELFEGINYISTTEDIALLKLKYVTNKDELAEIKQDISTIKTEQTEQNKQIDILLNALPSETQEDENINIKGTIPTKFKEFKVSGNSKQETRSGKNLLDLTKSEVLRGGTIEFKESSIVAKLDGTIAMQIKVPCPLEQGDYFVHLEDVSDVNLAFRGVSGENASSNVYVSKAITLSENLDYLVINIATLTDEVEIAYDKLYINEGNTDLGYEPYGAMPSPEYPSEIQNVEENVNVSVCNTDKTEQQIVTFPLSEGQKLYKGDYLADDGIHHVRKQIELDGTENWELYSDKAARISRSDVKGVPNVSHIGSILSNFFKTETQADLQMGVADNGIAVRAEGNNGIVIRIAEFTTLQEYKDWLSSKKSEGTPVIAEYELSEEEIEAYTPEQQEAYNQLCNLTAYEEETNIYSINEVSPVFTVTAVKDINSVITQLNAVLLERS